MRKFVHLQSRALASLPPENSPSPPPHYDDFALNSILSNFLPLPKNAFDLTTLSLIVLLLFLSLSAIAFIFHLYEKSRRLYQLQDFNSLWIIRLYLVLLATLWGVNEISRLPYVRRKYLHTFLPPLNLEGETTICKIHNVLSLGFLEPGFLITLLFLINVSIKKRNPRCIWAILTVLTLCIPTLFLQLFFAYFSPLKSKLPSFMYISSVITTDRLGNKVILCTCPFFSWLIFTGFAIAYAIAFSFSCWRVMAYAINKAIGHRINVLATTVMVALPLQIVCLSLSWLWMLEQDVYGLVEPASSSADIAALRAFKSAIKPASIPPSSCLATWNFSSDPCAAPRVTHFTCGLTCAANRVVQITLDSQGYSGKLSPSISALTELINLDLGDNGFYGPIPASLSSLPNLRNLILRVNSFSGAVPPSIASLRSLETLDLSRNSISGALPDMNSLTGLTRLDLSYNRLTGSVPRLPPNLNELALKANSLSGSLTKHSFNGLNRLMVVELSENSFAGALEPWFFLLPSLQQANLAKNTFTSIAVAKPPTNSGELIAVDLSYNKFEGFLPVNFADYPMLRSLSLSYNKFRGPIPWQYSKKGSSLQRLYLDGNYLNGSPPEGFFSGERPVSGSLGDNCLQSCPVSSELCLKSQKPASICQQAYGGKPKS